MRPLLRPIRPADLEELYRLDQICFEPGIAYTRGMIGEFLRLTTAEAVAAEEGGRLAGFAIGCLPRGRVGHVVTLDVHPEHRRRGLGRALLEELLARLERAGAARVRLEVDARNEGAIAFYERFGFRRVRRLPDYYLPGRDAYEMERVPATGESGR